MFIALEGADCCGKGTQAEILVNRLEAKLFKFPDKGTPIGQLIYDHLFNRWNAIGAIECNAADDPSDQSSLLAGNLLDAMVFQCLQLVNRLEHAVELRESAGYRNTVADRYLASGIVYGGSDGLDPDYLHKIQKCLPQPDLNILLDIDVDVIDARMRERGDSKDRYENLEKLSDVVARYRKFWVEMRSYEGYDKWPIVDGSKGKVEVAADIIEHVKRIRAR